MPIYLPTSLIDGGTGDLCDRAGDNLYFSFAIDYEEALAFVGVHGADLREELWKYLTVKMYIKTPSLFKRGICK